MKRIGLLIVCAACLAVTPTMDGKANAGPQSQQGFNIDVTVTARIKGVGGTFADLFLGFSGPVQVPNATLPAGTYIFTEVPRYSQNYIRVTSEDGKTAFASFPIVMAKRMGSIDHAQVNFRRDGPGPLQIAEVYGQGTAIGYAPVYPTHHGE
jgi:hypothetical protein